jgi:protease IV
MTLDADSIAARRKLRRSLSFWRVAAILAAGLAILALVLAVGGDGFKRRTDHIARVRVEGLITGDRPFLKMLEKLEKADRVKAVIIDIDSPGGTTAGSEAIYEAIRKIAAKKPVVSVMGTIAASGGYITAIASDYIVARGNTITGSIGVIFQWAQLQKLLDTLGVQMQEVKSGELKAEPNFFKPPSEKALAVANGMIQDSFHWFTGLVTERRHLPPDRVLVLSDGRVYTGRQALQEKLIDALGGEDQALDWLRKEKKIPESLKVVNWKPDDESSAFGLGLVKSMLGLDRAGFASLLLNAKDAFDVARLDGLLSVWQARP